FLMALGEPLPKKVFAHPWLLFGNDKMSKSKGNVMYADDLIKYFGLDAVRYYLISAMPLTTDGSITYENVISLFNTDLANTFGNLASRTVAMTKKYFGGTIPSPAEATEFDAELKDAATAAYKGFVENIESYRLSDAVNAAMELSRRANKYIDLTTPWALAKDESQKGRLGTVIYNLLETLRISALLLSPVMPDACGKILSAIGADGDEFESAATFGGLKSGVSVGDLPILFARIDEAKMLQAIEADKAENE
ncbi:MAG: class I tRNA ligase family protein, partial [Clostridia bacterium]|nr:class I tRNA ligase family protein [Clostridia bacterium]